MGKGEARNRRYEDKGTDRWLPYVGDFPISSRFLSEKEYSSPYGLIKFIDALLRGYGQVVFANNPFSGFLFAIALTWADPSVSLKGLFTASIGLAVSILLRLPKNEIDNGHTVFNSLLLGLVSGAVLPGRLGIEFETKHWVYVAVFSVMSVFVTSAAGTFFSWIGKQRLLCFALPFNIMQFLFFICAVHIHNNRGIFSTDIRNSTTNPVFTFGSENVTFTNGSLNILDLVNTNVLQEDVEGVKVTENFVVSSTIFPMLKLEENSTEAVNSLADYVEVVTSSSDPLDDKINNTVVSEGNPENDTEKLEIESLLGGLTRRKRNLMQSTEKNLHWENKTMEFPHNVDMDLHWGKIFSGIILSMSQVFGACHVPGSLLMYLGVLVCSPITAAFAVAGATLGTLTGLVLSEYPYTEVYEGVWGFNGLLSCAALGGFCYVLTWQSTATALISVIFTTVLQRALMIALQQSNFPVISLPFNLTAMLFLCVTADSRRLARPDALSFPEKHLYLFRQDRTADAQNKRPTQTPPSPKTDKKQEEEEKTAPLAEQEVV